MEAIQKPLESGLENISEPLKTLLEVLVQDPFFASFEKTNLTLNAIGSYLENIPDTDALNEFKKKYFEILFEIDKTHSEALLELSLEPFFKPVSSETLAPTIDWDTPLQPDLSIIPPTESGDTLSGAPMPLLSLAQEGALAAPLEKTKEEMTLPHIQPHKSSHNLWTETEVIPQMLLRSAHSQELSELDSFLETQKEYLKGSPLLQHLEKLILQTSCHIVESESRAALMPALSELLSNKQSLLNPIFHRSPKGIELKPELKAAIESLAGASGIKISFTGLLNSLKYFSTVSLDQVKFTLYDYGVLLLVFGHTTQAESYGFQNYLSSFQLSSEETLELAFSYLQLQRLKTKIATFEPIFDPNVSEEIVALKTKILKTLEKIT